MYFVIHKRACTPSRDLTTQMIETFDHSSTSELKFTYTKIQFATVSGKNDQ